MATLVISYSRADRPQVRMVVSLLKAALRGVDRAVFWDDDFEPGDPWFEQIRQHIEASPQLFVFWCEHSAASDQVRREFLYAMHRGKRVVPVLLDDTELSAELAPIHGIDLRGAIVHSDDDGIGEGGPATPVERRPGTPAATTARRPRDGRRGGVLAASALGTAAAVAVAVYLMTASGAHLPPPPDVDPSPTAISDPTWTLLGIVVAVACLSIALIVRGRARRGKRVEATIASPAPQQGFRDAQVVVDAFRPFLSSAE